MDEIKIQNGMKKPRVITYSFVGRTLIFAMPIVCTDILCITSHHKPMCCLGGMAWGCLRRYSATVLQFGFGVSIYFF